VDWFWLNLVLWSTSGPRRVVIILRKGIEFFCLAEQLLVSEVHLGSIKRVFPDQNEMYPCKINCSFYEHNTVTIYLITTVGRNSLVGMLTWLRAVEPVVRASIPRRAYASPLKRPQRVWDLLSPPPHYFGYRQLFVTGFSVCKRATDEILSSVEGLNKGTSCDSSTSYFMMASAGTTLCFPWNATRNKTQN
jgi:hypothetical protein